MKNIILTLIILFTLSCKAQSPIVNIASDYDSDDIVDGCYLKDVNNSFAPFIGTWQWTNGTDTLTIVFSKIEMVYNNLSEMYTDQLIGKYKYVENGVEIFNTLDYDINANNAWDLHPNYPKRMLAPMLGACYRNTTLADFSFMDYLKDKGEVAKFELLDLLTDLNGEFNVTQAKLTLSNREHWNVNGQNPRDPEFTIPNNITLTKQ
ncbi:DUF6705 family protein [Mangrovimonas spongiae]|uniref:DUF6705 domain-containing protein n=1 Tax=Mangrovimonas spongiae TaxID=2494697 RepID=A0A3R9PMM1_9FLAO|nr:DUF6705 family protein [Mangrovimonas spongiae]RSK41773.1 hypothetical protein EJA19_02520 [Mangrovimonas spongiae]